MLVTFYILFLPAFHAQAQKRADAEMQRSMLEAELEQSQAEMDSLRRMETQTAVYQHDMRHHLNMLDGLLSAGESGQAVDYIRRVQADIEAITPRRFCENQLVNLLCSSFTDKAQRQDTELTVEARLPDALTISAVLAAEQRPGKRPARRGGAAGGAAAGVAVLRGAAEQAADRGAQPLRR